MTFYGKPGSEDERLTPDVWQRVSKNLFPAAIPAVENWERKLWHHFEDACDTWKEHASQALAIDVFGTFKAASDPVRDAVVGKLASLCGLPSEGPWAIDLEWNDPKNRMREQKTHTQVDAVASSGRGRIFFECKFTEPDGGGCSQTRLIRRKDGTEFKQCQGRYESTTNPANGRKASCALTGKKIRYWDVIPSIFEIDVASLEGHECPFKGSWFQWMRNLSVCVEVARDEGTKPAFVIVYADSAQLAIPRMLNTERWGKFLSLTRPEVIEIRTMSYQTVVQVALSAVAQDGEESKILTSLQSWVDRKIASVGGASSQ